jgi:hypothetical protein
VEATGPAGRGCFSGPSLNIWAHLKLSDCDNLTGKEPEIIGAQHKLHIITVHCHKPMHKGNMLR